jgi:hypothetical protein
VYYDEDSRGHLVPDDAVAALARLAQGGPVLELGVGKRTTQSPRPSAPRRFGSARTASGACCPQPSATFTPPELDLMAHLAGLQLASRHAGRHGRPFDASSTHHVSSYVIALRPNRPDRIEDVNRPAAGRGFRATPPTACWMTFWPYPSPGRGLFLMIVNTVPPENSRRGMAR